MIRGTHLILYSADADADRALLLDLLGRPSVDAGGGWLILQLPPAELAVHPAEASGAIGMYLACDDIEATAAELAARGVAVDGAVEQQSWGRATTIRLPSGSVIGLYEPSHPAAFDR